MATHPTNLLPSTPEATAAVSQSRGEESLGAEGRLPEESCQGEGIDFRIGNRVSRAVHAVPYERKTHDPIYRPLRIFSLDPDVSRLEGSVAVVNVPYEPLEPGPTSPIFKVD